MVWFVRDLISSSCNPLATWKSHSLLLDFPPLPCAINIHARGFKINIITILTYFFISSQVNIAGGLGPLLWEVFCTDMGIVFYSQMWDWWTGYQCYRWNGLVHRRATFQRVFKARYHFPFPWDFSSLFNKNNFQQHMCRYRGLPKQVGLKAALV